MSVSKLTINGATQMDLTQDTVDAENLMTGYTAHAADGSAVTGTHVDGGGGAVAPVESGVEFFDYDGTLLHAYTTAQALELDALPENPSHTGLTAQGWNWTLAEIQGYLTNHQDGLVVVGQMYITDDGKTRIYIHLDDLRKSPILSLAVNGTVDVDWGDGTSHDTLTGNSLTYTKNAPIHYYENGGDYIIKINVLSGTAGISGTITDNAWSYLLRGKLTANSINGYYLAAIQKVELGSGMIILKHGFNSCISLKSITMPITSDTSIPQYAFVSCSSLGFMTVPNSVTTIDSHAYESDSALEHIALPCTITNIGTYAFNNAYGLKTFTPEIPNLNSYTFTGCFSIKKLIIKSDASGNGGSMFASCINLQKIVLPNTVTTINMYQFNLCRAITKITVPSNVSSIGQSAFNGCGAVKEYHFLPTTPPTLSAANAFNYIPEDCIIYVPYSADHSILAAYQAATNWSTYASYMQEEQQ